MKKQHALLGFILIGIGVYFLLKKLHFPILTDFYSWPTLLILIGLAFLLHGYFSKDYTKLFPGTIVLGLGIHFHGLNHYLFWIDHWGVYLLILSTAYLVRFQKTKSGLFPGLILLFLALFSIFTSKIPNWFPWINKPINMVEEFWPVLLIIIGVFLLIRKSK